MTTATIDYPHLRAAGTCPLCAKAKPSGLVCCWPCYRSHNVRYGNGWAEAQFEAAERTCQQLDRVFERAAV